MIIALKTLLFSVVVLALSYAIGARVVALLRESFKLPGRVTLKIYTGGVLLILVGSIVCYINGLFHGKTTTAFIAIVMIFSVLILLGYYIAKVGIGKNHKGKIDKQNMVVYQKVAFSKKDTIHLLTILAFVLVQIVVVMYYGGSTTETLRRVSEATLVYDNGVNAQVTPIMNLWGMVASLMRIHPMVLIYSYLPAVTISLYYIGVYEVVMALSNGDNSLSLIATTFGCLLNIFGYQSELLVPFSLLFSYFSQGLFVVSFLLPAVGMILAYYYENVYVLKEISLENETDMAEEDEEYQEEWDMKKHKIINARNLAIALGVMLVMFVVVVFVLNNKINTLHESTANLQRDLNERCAVYEYSSEPGKTEGYLIKGSDGSLTFIGGGKAENADAVLEFIEEHNNGKDLDNWYLYSTDENDIGAYLKLVYEGGMPVENVYILDRKELSFD